MSENKYNRVLEGTCPHCQLYQCLTFRGSHGEHPLTAPAICRACKKRIELKDQRKIDFLEGRSRLPTLDELMDAAKRTEHSMPILAKIILRQIEAGAFKGAPQNMDEILEQADNGDPF